MGWWGSTQGPAFHGVDPAWECRQPKDGQKPEVFHPSRVGLLRCWSGWWWLYPGLANFQLHCMSRVGTHCAFFHRGKISRHAGVPAEIVLTSLKPHLVAGGARMPSDRKSVV